MLIERTTLEEKITAYEKEREAFAQQRVAALQQQLNMELLPHDSRIAALKELLEAEKLAEAEHLEERLAEVEQRSETAQEKVVDTALELVGTAKELVELAKTNGYTDVAMPVFNEPPPYGARGGRGVAGCERMSPEEAAAVLDADQRP